MDRATNQPSEDQGVQVCLERALASPWDNPTLVRLVALVASESGGQGLVCGLRAKHLFNRKVGAGAVDLVCWWESRWEVPQENFWAPVLRLYLRTGGWGTVTVK